MYLTHVSQTMAITTNNCFFDTEKKDEKNKNLKVKHSTA